MLRGRTVVLMLGAVLAGDAAAQLNDVTQTPNLANEGIKKSLVDQVGAGRGDVLTPGSSLYLIKRDPARSIARGRQLFQRKFTMAQGFGPRTGDGVGDIMTDGSLGAGLVDSCAGCHGRPRGSAGAGGNVFTRPDSRDAPHLFGLGLVEMLADEITADLRALRDEAVAQAVEDGNPVDVALESKGIGYGSLTAFPDGTVDTAGVEGVDPDLRVKPFFAEGSSFSIREFAVGAFNAEMGLEAPDPDLLAASQGADVLTPSGMLLSGSQDALPAPPVATPAEDSDLDGVVNEIDVALVDHMEFYLLNYFKPARGAQTVFTDLGNLFFKLAKCNACHVQDLVVDVDRRVADVETGFDPDEGVFNGLFAEAVTMLEVVDDGQGEPPLLLPAGEPFVVEDVFTDLKRHDLGPAFHERNFDGFVQTQFMTEPLWGVGSTAPYGHDGRSMTLRDVILRHGGEAETSRELFEQMTVVQQFLLLEFLRSLVLFPPPDTASNLDPGDPDTPGFPQFGHGSIDLSQLFGDPDDKE